MCMHAYVQNNIVTALAYSSTMLFIKNMIERYSVLAKGTLVNQYFYLLIFL